MGLSGIRRKSLIPHIPILVWLQQIKEVPCSQRKSRIRTLFIASETEKIFCVSM
jgi:hypothetical protein